MDSREKKVCVAIGNEREEGFKTLKWAIQKWKVHPLSIIILHVRNKAAKDTVKTPFGKMPTSSVNEEMVEAFRKEEQEKTEKLLSEYKAFCGKVKAEIFSVEKNDKPIHEIILDLISRHRITILVVALSFMKASSWRSKSAMGGSFYIHQNKPDFCEFFIVCGGEQLLLREENDERIMENEKGVKVRRVRDRANIRSWLEKTFLEKFNDLYNRSSPPSPNPDSSHLRDQWEKFAQEIETYFQHLLSLDEEEDVEQENEVQTTSQNSPMEAEMMELANSNMTFAEKSEWLRKKTNETKEKIQTKKKEAKANVERHAKAEWAITLCNRRADELESLAAKQATARAEIKKELDATRVLLQKMRTEIEESKNELTSLSELQPQLAKKLRIFSMAKSKAEAEIERAAAERSEMVRGIEELRRQKDVLRRRVEFCREGDAIEMVKLSCDLREYSCEEIKMATDNFSEGLRLKSGGDWTSFYKGRINLQTVAVKIFDMTEEDFQMKVKFLSNIRHPDLIAMTGFCSDPKCIAFEYMHNGSLKDMLFSSCRNQALLWHRRVHIAAQVFSGLGYLHKAQPRPIIHGHLTASNILLDRNLDAKISGFGLTRGYDDGCDVGPDLRAFGLLVLHLLSGRNWAGLIDEAMLIDKTALVRVLDPTAGDWPLDLAERLARLGFKCLGMDQGANGDLEMEKLMEELEELRRKVDEIVEREKNEVVSDGGENRQDSIDVPCVFLCPIFQEVMKNPHVAADGFSYEMEAIEEWLRMGRDTSPMTNLKLEHTFLTPNYTLRSLIEDWQNKISTSPS
ncbi:hypothetical protein UlMin_038804 [Ulmus minor]